MNKHSDIFESTPALSYQNVSFWRTEDSGYHTSLTPGSIDASEISLENIDPSSLNEQVSVKARQYNLTRGAIKANNGNFIESPITRRGTKRSFHNIKCSQSIDSTPTSIIAGEIQKLYVNENENNIKTLSTSLNSELSEKWLHAQNLSYPSTPIKRVCRSSCKLSPFSHNSVESPLSSIENTHSLPKKSAKKLNFTIHSLSCESRGLQSVELKFQSKVVRKIFKPEQKVDIVRMLYQKVCCMPAILKIFSFLSNTDIYNFSLVSSDWFQISENVTKARSKKQEHIDYLEKMKENQENKEQRKTQKHVHHHAKALKERQNILNSQSVDISVTSPPTSPKSMRFKRFTKSASLDSRSQLSCVRCSQPSKVTEEVTGEEWAECTSIHCSYKFCRFCMCDRHPGRHCIRFDLEGPSPSKRKKSAHGVGTNKSRKNLRRLL